VKLRLPHPLVLLLGGVAVAALLTWILPAGEYQRVIDPATQRAIVVPGTYAPVASSPVGPMAMLVGVTRGVAAGIEVILSILIVGGAFALLETTGALSRLLGALLGKTTRPRLLVGILCVVFAAFGAAESMHEEFIALMPVLVVLSVGLGFGAITALAMSMGAALVGAMFGPTNPFGSAIALRFAELPAMSAIGVRLGMLVAGVAIWTAYVLWRAESDDIRPVLPMEHPAPPTGRDVVALLVCVLPILIYSWGVLARDWGINELTAMFLVSGFAVGLLQSRTLTETTVGFISGMELMLGAGLLVGVARAISVVLTDGKVIDTIIAGLVAPLGQMPALAAATLMIPVHAVLHIAVPSFSGQAVLTMPIMAPLADLLGFSRDGAVIAYQAGAIITDLINPTNGAMLAMLYKANVPYGRWVRFAVPGMLLMWGIAFVGLVIVR
jgi:uncharacterized ion transporter superfamily protein YfcC